MTLGFRRVIRALRKAKEQAMKADGQWYGTMKAERDEMAKQRDEAHGREFKLHGERDKLLADNERLKGDASRDNAAFLHQIEELEATLDDEEAAHQETLRLWKESVAALELAQERLRWAQYYCPIYTPCGNCIECGGKKGQPCDPSCAIASALRPATGPIGIASRASLATCSTTRRSRTAVSG